ncbi:MAG: AEC family transporter [Spirochaetaceae bacterium]
MGRLLFILSVSLGSVVVGYLVRRAVVDRYALSPDRVSTFSKDLKLISMFVLNPLPIISSFWTFSIENSALLFFPFLGVLCTSIGGIAALIINSIFRIPPKQAASVFTSGMFSNILTFGGLTAFVFFGIEGYVLVQLFNMLITSMYYLVGFPISHQVSLGSRFRFTLSFDIMKERPYLLIPVASIVIGLILNVLNLPRPQIFLSLTSLFIPLISGMLGFSIGITLYVGKIQDYCRYILLISVIKFAISPLLMASVGLLLGLHTMMGGLPFKILIIASAMPVAFNSLIPPALYDFDLDLANSAWIVTTFAFIVILPILYVFLEV